MSPSNFIEIPNILTTHRHHIYQRLLGDWEKFRNVMTSGDDFIETYLQKFSDRESDPDFTSRKNLTYNPAFAKAALQEVNNAIYQRLVDITRVGGPQSYINACLGLNGGVDRQHSSMTYFIGTKVLIEMLAMKKIGVFVDRKPLPYPLMKGLKKPAPYLYTYKAEDILSWTYDEDGCFTAVLLRDYTDKIDETTGLVSDIETQYRLLRQTAEGVQVTFYNAHGAYDSEYLLNLPKIPFVVAEISESLLTDIANHQIALLNIASSDLAFIMFANFPFYTEQYNPMDTFALPPGPTNPDLPEDATSITNDSTTNKLTVGVMKGRRYPKGTDQPGFINPSSEPLKISMEKQQEIKTEIRSLINLTIANLKPVRASAESKIQDDRTLEAGLSYIGLELEHLENNLAYIWSLYEGETNGNFAEVKYPHTYSLKTDKQRFDEGKQLVEFMKSIPSKTYCKAVAREIARITVGSKISTAEATQIDQEIDQAEVINTDPQTIRDDHEAGLVSTETASKLRGYPEGEVIQAKKDHAERLARIAESQAKGDNGRPPIKLDKPSDRGVSDLESE